MTEAISGSPASNGPVYLEVLAAPPAQFSTSTPTPPIEFGGPARYSASETASLTVEATEIIGRYPQSGSALLPLLHLVQSHDGYITRAGIGFCAATLKLTAAQVASVATFYSMYRREPTGEYLIGVCTNTLCAVLGGDEILAALTDHFGVKPGETTADGRLTIEHVECNAACDFAPVVMVNWEFYDNQTPTSATELAEDLRAGVTPAPSRGNPTLCTFRRTARLLAGAGSEASGPNLSGAGSEASGPNPSGAGSEASGRREGDA